MAVSETSEYRLGSVYAVPLMLFFIALILFVALLQRQHELTALCLITLGMMMVAFIWSRASLRATRFDLEVERHRLFPGDRLQINLEVVNQKALPIHMDVRTGCTDGCGSSRTTAFKSRSGGLLGYQRAVFRWRPVFSRRGVYAVGPLQVRAGDPLGFFPLQRQISAGCEIVVYPRLIPLRRFEFPRREAFGAPGGLSHVSDPVLIQGTREYQASEPARHIHWKASARHRRLQAKVFSSSYQEKSMLLLDVSGFEHEQDDADFEKILEVIASLAKEKDRQGCATGFLTNSNLVGSSAGILPPARNPNHISMILETLARCTRTSSVDLMAQLQRGTEIPWGTSCALFTRKGDRSAELVKAYLARRMLQVNLFSAEATLALCDGSSSGENRGSTNGENKEMNTT